MDPRERLDPQQEAQQAALDGRQAQIYTAIPGIIQSFDPAKMTCVVQPALKPRQQTAGGSVQQITHALILDVPVIFPAGGGFSLTFPVKKGDECLTVFAQRCIDAWWQNGGVQAQEQFRMHSPSDGFALVGVRSQPRVLSAYSATAVQLRSDDGSAYVQIDGGDNVTVVGTTINLNP